MKAFKSISHPICYSKPAQEVFAKYQSLIKVLQNYEEDVFKSWVVQTEKRTVEGLDRPLLIRNPKERTLKVNFSRETLACLNEVKYLTKEFPNREIPKPAAEVFKRFEDFRLYNNCLDVIVDLYNYLKTDTIEKEYRLFESEVNAIDEQLKDAETKLTWNSEGIDDYIENIRVKVTELNERVRKTQDNIIEIYKQVVYAFRFEEKKLIILHYCRSANGSKHPCMSEKRMESSCSTYATVKQTRRYGIRKYLLLQKE